MEGYPESTFHTDQEKAIAFHTLDAPKNVESSDWLRPPNGWPQWGSSGSCETFGLPEKNSIMGSSSSLDGSFQGISGCPVSVMLQSEYLKQNNWQDVPLDFTDFDFCNDLGVMQADNLFLNSSQDLSGKEKLDGSFCACPDCRCGLYLAEDSLMNSTDLQSIVSKNNYMDSSNFRESDYFTPSMEWDMEATALHSAPCNNRQEIISVSKSSSIHTRVPSEETEMSLEESILQELNAVMGQFTKKIRICLRDSLYRLAENAKQQHYNRTLRPESGKVEIETNIIDRAVANFMYNKTGCSVKSPESLDGRITREQDLFWPQGLELQHDHQVPGIHPSG
ncbi:hypothetical protein SAY87_029652 [Trapa incisa]|uniref:Protein LNK3 n=1 Tax=Trapa incisa TaxID=236973 RepID=A0AAN7KC26_9MYRT|nr:hypothetical protein SAY87_029652 [Trapa incisa]